MRASKAATDSVASSSMVGLVGSWKSWRDRLRCPLEGVPRSSGSAGRLVSACAARATLASALPGFSRGVRLPTARLLWGVVRASAVPMLRAPLGVRVAADAAPTLPALSALLLLAEGLAAPSSDALRLTRFPPRAERTALGLLAAPASPFLRVSASDPRPSRCARRLRDDAPAALEASPFSVAPEVCWLWSLCSHSFAWLM
mmetsp:Transcript_18910/g.36485  ORF Transcript_18910/g.36485 Transcript_18910/m.36485 type:complete len:201 (+) Transcript_18910:2456-3058(+)